jgi:hypothetical protein
MARMVADSLRLTEAQRIVLGKMMGRALVEIRNVGTLDGARAADLADVFHNLPAGMSGAPWWDRFEFREDLVGYQRRYADREQPSSDFVSMFDEVFGEEFAEQIGIKRYLESRSAVRVGAWRDRRGVVKLLARVVSSPGSSREADEAGEWFYGLIGSVDGSRWSVLRGRFAAVDEATAGVESFCPGIAWET